MTYNIKMQDVNARRRTARAKSFCIDNTQEFCKNTTLHGLKYVADKELGIFERVFFGISFIAVVVVVFHLISNVYAKWQNTPVIVGLNAVPTFITKSPFPAVTICNLNQAMKSQAMPIKNDSLEYAMLQILCSRDVPLKYANAVKNWTILENFIIEMAQPCNSMLLSCRFGSIEYNCSEIFQTVLTDEGLCCAFNMVHPVFMIIREQNKHGNNLPNLDDGSVPIDWNPERGYPKDLPPKYYPRVAAGTGESLGFTVVLDVELDDYYCSSSNGAGFKVSLHSPTETPHLKETGLLLQAGYETKMRITAVKSEAGSELRSIRKEYRQCLFNGESTREYYKFYTKRNCEIECDAKLLIKNCDCVSYYLPKLYPNTSICGIKDMDCVERVTRRSHLVELNEFDCHDFCLPSCYDLTFLPDFFASPISHNGFSIKHQLIQNISNEYASQNIAVVHMYFKENTFRSSVKTQFIGVTDFLSNTGGLMGLFMGFSFISLAEFVYYAFIRPIRRSINKYYCKRLKNLHLKDFNKSHLSQTIPPPPLDYNLNKRNYNYRSRLVHPAEVITTIHNKEYGGRVGTITKSLMDDTSNHVPAYPYPYYN